MHITYKDWTPRLCIQNGTGHVPCLEELWKSSFKSFSVSVVQMRYCNWERLSGAGVKTLQMVLYHCLCYQITVSLAQDLKSQEYGETSSIREGFKKRCLKCILKKIKNFGMSSKKRDHHGERQRLKGLGKFGKWWEGQWVGDSEPGDWGQKMRWAMWIGHEELDMLSQKV